MPREILSLPIKELILYSLSQRSLLLELFTILGTQSTLKIISYFGGTEIKLPTKYEIQKQIKEVLIYKMYKEKKSIISIATHFKMNEEDVQNCIKKVEVLAQKIELEKTKAGTEDMSKKELEDFILSLEGEDYEDYEHHTDNTIEEFEGTM